MNEQLIGEVLEELAPALKGRHWGKVFQLSGASLAVDFRTGDGRYLLISVEPGRARLHMISRTVRELENASLAPSQFALVVRKTLGGATLRSLTQDAGERVVRFAFSVPDAVGDESAATLVAQLTGRTSNLFLLDAQGRILDSLRPSRGEGQSEGEIYSPPASQSANALREGQAATLHEGQGASLKGQAASLRESQAAAPRKAPVISREGFSSLSGALDSYYQRLEAARAFDARGAAATARLRQQISSRRKLRDNLARDLAAHGDAEEHKRAGDLLLSNIGTAERRGRTVRLIDFYAEDTPFVEMEVDENRSLQEEAARRFARYTKAKRAAREIAERLEKIEPELAALEVRRAELERIIASRDETALATFNGADAGLMTVRVKAAQTKRTSEAKGAKGAKAAADKGRTLRRYRSTDGYEIIVGRGARENDQLTFRVARSYDTWMHAADYPGSHVVIRAQNREEPVPHRTVVEAAQLAAHFSQARKDAKVAVNYTQRKFVSKPKGAAPGLVYISTFRTLLVEPREELERL